MGRDASSYSNVQRSQVGMRPESTTFILPFSVIPIHCHVGMRYTSVYASGPESWTWSDIPVICQSHTCIPVTRHHTHNIVTAVPSGRLPQGKPTSAFVAIHGWGFRRVYIETLACSVSGCRRRITYSRPFHRFIPQSII